MAKGIRYSAEQRQDYINKWIAEGRPPFTTWARQQGLASETFKKWLIGAGHQVGSSSSSAPTASTSKDNHFNDFLNRKVENQEALYLQWLKDERERLLTRVQELESQINPDR